MEAIHDALTRILGRGSIETFRAARAITFLQRVHDLLYVVDPGSPDNNFAQHFIDHVEHFIQAVVGQLLNLPVVGSQMPTADFLQSHDLGQDAGRGG